MWKDQWTIKVGWRPCYCSSFFNLGQILRSRGQEFSCWNQVRIHIWIPLSSRVHPCCLRKNALTHWQGRSSWSHFFKWHLLNLLIKDLPKKRLLVVLISKETTNITFLLLEYSPFCHHPMWRIPQLWSLHVAIREALTPELVMHF